MFRYNMTAVKYNTYGDRIVDRFPTSILANNLTEAIDKGHLAYSATYDDFRKFWSIGFVVDSVSEEDDTDS
jgi:hypothetical protein